MFVTFRQTANRCRIRVTKVLYLYVALILSESIFQTSVSWFSSPTQTPLKMQTKYLGPICVIKMPCRLTPNTTAQDPNAAAGYSLSFFFFVPLLELLLELAALPSLVELALEGFSNEESNTSSGKSFHSRSGLLSWKEAVCSISGAPVRAIGAFRGVVDVEEEGSPGGGAVTDR